MTERSKAGSRHLDALPTKVIREHPSISLDYETTDGHDRAFRHEVPTTRQMIAVFFRWRTIEHGIRLDRYVARHRYVRHTREASGRSQGRAPRFSNPTSTATTDEHPGTEEWSGSPPARTGYGVRFTGAPSMETFCD